MKKKIPRMIVMSRMKHIDSDLAWHEHGTPEPVTNLGTTCIEPEGGDSGWLMKIWTRETKEMEASYRKLSSLIIPPIR